MILRFANPGDIPECVEIGRDFWKVSPYASTIEYNPESVGNLLGKLVENELMLVAEYEEGIVGVAAIVVAPMPFDPSIKIANELFWYVRPGLRAHGIGGAMLSNLEAMARAKGANVLSMGTMQSSDPEKAENLFSANGYNLTEKSFTKVI